VKLWDDDFMLMVALPVGLLALLCIALFFAGPCGCEMTPTRSAHNETVDPASVPTPAGQHSILVKAKQ
jgi:hypothetical protein